jgi:hypothetical protein
MNTTIDLSSELLIDRSTIRDPYLRLLLTAIGEELARGSPWVAVNKKIASLYGVAGQLLHLLRPQADLVPCRTAVASSFSKETSRSFEPPLMQRFRKPQRRIVI